jgi:hypothetical protein
MSKWKIKLIGALAVLMLLVGLYWIGSVYHQKWARSGWVSLEVKLPHNQKLITATWKEQSLWYLTRPKRADEPFETHVFQEQSLYGVLQGSITFKERP